MFFFVGSLYMDATHCQHCQARWCDEDASVSHRGADLGSQSGSRRALLRCPIGAHGADLITKNPQFLQQLADFQVIIPWPCPSWTSNFSPSTWLGWVCIQLGSFLCEICFMGFFPPTSNSPHSIYIFPYVQCRMTENPLRSVVNQLTESAKPRTTCCGISTSSVWNRPMRSAMISKIRFPGCFAIAGGNSNCWINDRSHFGCFNMVEPMVEPMS